jgi:hypothetical protein
VSVRGDRIRKEPRSGDAAKAAPQGSTSEARWRSNPSAPTKIKPPSQGGFFMGARETEMRRVYTKVWGAGIYIVSVIV